MEGAEFVPLVPEEGTMYVSPPGGKFLSFFSESGTNSLVVKDGDFNGTEHVLCRYRSVTEDGKIGMTNYGVELSGSIRREVLFPEYFHPEDRGGFCVYLKNLQNIGKEVRMTVDFSSRDELLFQTNVMDLAAGRDRSFRFIFPPVMRSTRGFGCRVRLIAHEFSDEQRKDVRMYPFPYDAGVIPGISVRKEYKVFGRELGSAFLPRSPVCDMDDIIRVTLRVQVKGARGAASSTNGGFSISDIVPSGCRIRLSGSGASGGVVRDDRISFPLPETAGKTTFVYYLRAELPGRYAVYPPLVSVGGEDFLTRTRRTPVGEVTVLY